MYLQIRDLNKRFGKFVALDQVSLDIAAGEFVVFLGPSGCGKTTLLRAIAGLEPQDEGSIVQGGKDVSRLSAAQRDFGIVFQSYALFPNLTVEDNIAYGLDARAMGAAHVRARVEELLLLVGLPGVQKKYPSQLSGGQQQRVALARALAGRPGLLLLDEPLSALDALERMRLRGEIRALQKRLGITTIMVTHDQEEAMAVADRIVVMNAGRIEQIGDPREIYRRPASAFVAGFIGRVNMLAGTVGNDGDVQVGTHRLGCADARGLTPGAAVRLLVRPEDISLLPAMDSRPNSLLARVRESSFLGPHFEVTLEPQELDGALLHARFAPNHLSGVELESGALVRVGLTELGLRVLPEQVA